MTTLPECAGQASTVVFNHFSAAAQSSQSHGRLAFPVRLPQAARTREHSKIDGRGDRALGPHSAEDHP